MDRLLIEEKCPARVAQLEHDVDLQDIITLYLTRAVQLIVGIAAHWVASSENMLAPSTMGRMFDALVQEKLISQKIGERMRASVGFWNIAVHDYESIDWQIVYSICTTHVVDISELAKLVYRSLNEKGKRHFCFLLPNDAEYFTYVRG